MSPEPRFLRSRVIIEPLVDRFYAWLQTVAPVQAAMNLKFLQVPLLESYLQSPQVHVAASNNPKLRGGFFINVPEKRVGEIRDLLAEIKQERAGMLRFAEAVATAHELLRANATGFDLTPLYSKLPSELSGLTELAYDTENQASMRFIEPLVYQSTAYDERRQSVQLSLEPGVERPFILSTPRLASSDVLELPIPFRHPGLEELFAARMRPTTESRLREVFELDDAQTALMTGLLAPEPSPGSAYRGGRTHPVFRARVPAAPDPRGLGADRPVHQRGRLGGRPVHLRRPARSHRPCADYTRAPGPHRARDVAAAPRPGGDGGSSPLLARQPLRSLAGAVPVPPGPAGA